MSLTTEKITVAAADAQMRNSGGTAFEQWNVLLSRMTTGDDIVRYSDVDVYRGFCSGDEGVALLRDGKIIVKIMLAILA